MQRWKNLLSKRFTALNSNNPQFVTHSATLDNATNSILPRAAVALIIRIYPKDVPQVLLTKRAASLRSYAGDVCLPGGKYEQLDDNLVNTALRETKEEVGIPPDSLEFISTLPLLPAGKERVTAVTPVAFLLTRDTEISANASEVDAVFWAPLHIFLNENSKKKPKSFIYEGKIKFSTVAFDFFDAETQRIFLIWGFTARLCVLSAAVALDTSPHFPFTVLSITWFPSNGEVFLSEVIMRSSDVSALKSKL